MQISLVGFGIIGILLLISRGRGKTLLTALMLSLPFGATSWATLPSLGGSSPQIYTFLALALITTVILRPNAASDIWAALTGHWALFVLLLLAVYAVAGAYLLPRLFQGQTSAFIPIKGAIFEVPLSPVGGNMTQSAYFVLGIVTAIAVAAHLHRTRNWPVLASALLGWCTMNAVLGWVDLLAKMAGIVDLLAPIRTARYAFLTDVMERGFWRISGGFSEASGFAIHTVSCVAYSFAYWRETGSRVAATLCVANASALILSTSTTAYIAVVLISLPVVLSVLHSFAGRYVSKRNIQLLLLGLFGLVLAVSLTVTFPKAVAPVFDMLDTMVLNKSKSASAEERGYWNRRSLDAIVQTAGLGIGIGSSRASSWIVAVASQLGILGLAMFAALLVAVAQAPKRGRLSGIPAGSSPAGLVRGCRAAVMGALLGGSLSAGSADPGIVAFVTLSIAVSLPTIGMALTKRAEWQPRAPFAGRPTTPA